MVDRFLVVQPGDRTWRIMIIAWRVNDFKRAFFSWPSERWHMVQKMTTLIFCSKIPHGELINVVLFFVQDDDHFKYGGHKCAEYQHKNVAPEKCKASWLFFFLYVCVGDIGKLFKPKTRSFCLTLSSQLVFKYHLYFTAVKSNLENFFKTPFPYAV